MKKISHILLCCLYVLLTAGGMAQTRAMDSLHRVLKKTGNDTTRVNILNELSYNSYLAGDFNSEMQYAEQALKLAKALSWKKGIAHSLKNIGGAFQDQNNYSKSLENYNAALELFDAIHDEKAIAATYNDIGLVYSTQGNYPKALENHIVSLKKKEKTGDSLGIALSYNNIGLVYQNLGKYNEALENYTAALKLYRKFGNTFGIGLSYHNIGYVYASLKKYDQALENYLTALKIRSKSGDRQGLAITYNNIGLVYYQQGKRTEALVYYNKSLQMHLEAGNKDGMALCYTNIANVCIDQRSTAEAKAWLEKSLDISRLTGNKENLKLGYISLTRTDSLAGNYKEALENYKMYIVYRDSINNEENSKKLLRAEMQYAFDKQQSIEKIKQEKKDALAQQEKTQQVIILVSVIAGLLIVTVFSVFLFFKFKTVEKQKSVIETQKALIETKHQEIKDSINYAERIQRSFLATGELLDTYLKDYFIYFGPKDVVSGDFYWAAVLADGRFCLVAADSTGHGVPGAIMSIINIAALEKAIESERLNNPADILNFTRKKIIDTLAKNSGNEGGKDGMDCALLSFDFKQNKLEFALANNPLWLIRNDALIEYKPDKMPVGRHEKQNVPFTRHEITLEKGDLVYIFTDGYADQFGGSPEKKFKYKPLQKLLLDIHRQPMEKQAQVLKSTFEQWKGGLEQVDDLCFIGIKI